MIGPTLRGEVVAGADRRLVTASRSWAHEVWGRRRASARRWPGSRRCTSGRRGRRPTATRSLHREVDVGARGDHHGVLAAGLGEQAQRRLPRREEAAPYRTIP